MTAIIERLLLPLDFNEFEKAHLGQEPFALPHAASEFRGLLSWSLLFSILERHSNCWLPKKGFLPAQPDLYRGKLTSADAVKWYAQGHTVLVRHAEQAQNRLRFIAEDFSHFFRAPVDIQLYYTPANAKGFDWHYDIEDVFIMQSVGSKEFRLRRNTVSKRTFTVSEMQKDYFAEPHAGEIHCHLEAGDLLYIPAGWWHCAQAFIDSAHLSVGVLNPQRQRQPAVAPTIPTRLQLLKEVPRTSDNLDRP